MLSRLGRVLRVLAKLLASVILTLVLLEVGLRAFAPQPRYFMDFGDIYAPDPVTGYRLQAGAVSSNGRNRVNSLGFRDREYPVDKPDDAFRVLVLGDSYTFGVTRIEDVFTKVTERFLRDATSKEGKRVEVLSVGVPGWGTDEQFEWAKRFGMPLDPDVVVVAFYVGNDVVDNRELPDRVWVGGELVKKENVEAARAAAGRLRIEASRALQASHAYRAYQNVRNAEQIDLGRATLRRPDEVSVEFKDNTEKMVEMYLWRLGIFEKEASPYFAFGWRRTEEILAEMEGYFGARGIPLVLFIIPEQMQVNRRLMERLQEQKTPEELARIDLRLPQERLARIGARHGIEVVDPLDAFVEEGRELMLYFPDNAHWNVPGNLLGGHILAEALVERGLVPVASIPPRPELTPDDDESTLE